MCTISRRRTTHLSFGFSYHTRYCLHHLFAFTAQGLIPSLLGSLFLDISQATILEGLNMSKFVETLVASSPTIVCLTAMVHLKRDKEDKMIGTRYVWANPAMYPAGEELPAQCPGCHSIRSFRKPKGGDPNIHRFKCEGKHVNGSKCDVIKTFQAKNMKPVKNSYWMSGPWPVYGELPKQQEKDEEGDEDDENKADLDYIPVD
jgi:hypothetical protein